MPGIAKSQNHQVSCVQVFGQGFLKRSESQISHLYRVGQQKQGCAYEYACDDGSLVQNPLEGFVQHYAHSQQVQNTENNGSIGHNDYGDYGHHHGGAQHFRSAKGVVSAECAGDTAHQYEGHRKGGAYVCEEVEQFCAEGMAEHISQGEKSVVKHHTEYTEASDFVQGVDAFFFSQNITSLCFWVES